MSLAFLFAATRSERKEEEDERVLLASLRLEDIYSFIGRRRENFEGRFLFKIAQAKFLYEQCLGIRGI